jgi:hypothetical protein
MTSISNQKKDPRQSAVHCWGLEDSTPATQRSSLLDKPAVAHGLDQESPPGWKNSGRKLN